MSANHLLEPLKPHYAVLIIGAGINGCGVFRDLCLQGLDCLLIDRGDICQGASGASSRLIHGGLKYLETGEFRLVRESITERNRLLRNAPHCVKPIETLLPTTSLFGGLAASALRFLGIRAKMTNRGLLITKAGLRLYDSYGRKVPVLPRHHLLSGATLHAHHKGLDPSFIAAGLYFEAVITQPERLCLELVKDGVAANSGSTLQTYMTAGTTQTGNVIQLADRLAPVSHSITADVVINAGGAWIDRINAALGISSHYIGGSKGSHLVVEHAALHAALAGRMIYFGTSDGRVNLVYPFGQRVFIGSTDISVSSPDDAVCSKAEIDYILASLRQLFPDISIAPHHILFTTCGVRPLPNSPGVDIGAVSRDHVIQRDVLPGSKVPVLSLVGGKWTTFRAFSEQVTNEVLNLLGRQRHQSTEDLPIGGGRDFPARNDERNWLESNAGTWGLSPQHARLLLMRYGTEARAVAEFIAAEQDQPLKTVSDYSHREIAYLSRQHVRRLSDLLFRRTSLAIEGLLTEEVIREVASIISASLGWSDTQTHIEIVSAIAELDRHQPNQTLAKAA